MRVTGLQVKGPWRRRPHGPSSRVRVRILLAAAPWLLWGLAGAAAADPGYAFRGIVSETRPTAADFTLTAHTGKRVRLSDSAGRLRLLYFGYTHCPGICPTTLAEVHLALEELGPARSGRVRVFLVSVDPKRDTPERLARYLSHFGPAFTGLTGTPDEIAAVAAAYGIYYRVTEGRRRRTTWWITRAWSSSSMKRAR